MTAAEIRSLNPNKLHKFSFYYGSSKVGYVEWDFHSHKCFIVHPRNRNEKYEIRLEQIITAEVLPDHFTPQKRETYELPSGISKKGIILGAGASYDFTYDANSKRMPLTKDLFSDDYIDILKKYQGAFDLSSDILQSNDIEDYFQRQWSKIIKTNNVSLLRQLINTQYYIHDLFLSLSKHLKNTQKNNYLKLVKLAHEYLLEKDNELIPIITFNYDILLEEALSRQLNYYFSSHEDYVNFSNRNILLFKPHGSCNWVRRFDPRVYKNGISGPTKHISELAAKFYSQNNNLHDIYSHLNTNIDVLSSDEIKTLSGQAYYPTLLIPYKVKDEFSMPSKHAVILSHMLNSISELLIIGWKGTEDHFCRVLKNQIGGRTIKITLVEPSTSAAEKFITDFHTFLPNAEFEHVTNLEDGLTFSQYITSLNNSDSHFFSAPQT